MKLENVTTGTAVGAVSSPIWLPWLTTASDIAATAAPILGALWLIMQITAKAIEVYKKWYSGEDKQ